LYTELVAALRSGDITVAQFLERGGPVHFPDAEGRTCLHHASIDNKIEVARALLADGAVQVGRRDKMDNTALTLASQHGHAELVILLLRDRSSQDESDAGSDDDLPDDADVNHANDLGETSLILAACHGYLEVVTVLIDHGADIDALDVDHNTALLRASQSGHAPIVAFLLAHGAELDFINSSGMTALLLAIAQGANGHVEVVRLLLDSGAVVDQHDHTIAVSALPLAVEEGNAEVVRLLVERAVAAGRDDDGMLNSLPLIVMSYYVTLSQPSWQAPSRVSSLPWLRTVRTSAAS
jgi:serine/threonine-protein phosphatase 6 regulatory ankyrin repeat subunit B